MIDQIRWLGHGSFMIQGPPLIYINPWHIPRSTFLPDAILIGHDHYEHFSISDVEKLRGPETRVISNPSVVNQVKGAEVLMPWHSITIDRARITAIPAYSPEDFRHSKEDGGLGFLISMYFYDIYYAGDTQITPELERVQPDIAILPIDGNGTLTITEAAEVVKNMRPRYVIPSNWGGVGVSTTASLADVERFKELVGGRAQVVTAAEEN